MLGSLPTTATQHSMNFSPLYDLMLPKFVSKTHLLFAKKIALIEKINPEWPDLYEVI
jgi:hypothetical protein